MYRKKILCLIHWFKYLFLKLLHENGILSIYRNSCTFDLSEWCADGIWYFINFQFGQVIAFKFMDFFSALRKKSLVVEWNAKNKSKKFLWHSSFAKNLFNVMIWPTFWIFFKMILVKDTVEWNKNQVIFKCLLAEHSFL